MSKLLVIMASTILSSAVVRASTDSPSARIRLWTISTSTGGSSRGGKGSTKSNRCPDVKPAVTAGQCPCFEDNGKKICIAYDPQYQADSLQEAATNFQDMTLPESKDSHGIIRKCRPNDRRCNRCNRYVLEMLENAAKTITNISQRNITLEQLNATWKKFVNPAEASNYCPEYISLFLQQSTIAEPIIRLPDFGIGDCIRKGQNDGLSFLRDLAGIFRIPSRDGDGLSSILGGNTNNQGTDKPLEIEKEIPVPNESGGPVLADPEDSNVKDITKLYTIKCERRGTPIQGNPKYISLCSTCWKWGTLREGLYPKFMNLMTCDNDRRCLSGWGRCNQRKRNFQVLQRTPNGGYDPYTINVPIACDCQVEVGSALHGFVQR